MPPQQQNTQSQVDYPIKAALEDFARRFDSSQYLLIRGILSQIIKPDKRNGQSSKPEGMLNSNMIKIMFSFVDNSCDQSFAQYVNNFPNLIEERYARGALPGDFANPMGDCIYYYLCFSLIILSNIQRNTNQDQVIDLLEIFRRIFGIFYLLKKSWEDLAKGISSPDLRQAIRNEIVNSGYLDPVRQIAVENMLESAKLQQAQITKQS